MQSVFPMSFFPAMTTEAPAQDFPWLSAKFGMKTARMNARRGVRRTKSKQPLLERGHLGQRRLGGLQVAGTSRLHLGGRFGTPVGVAAVLLGHGFHVAAAPHPSARDVVLLPQRSESAPLVLRYLVIRAGPQTIAINQSRLRPWTQTVSPKRPAER